MKVCRCTMLGPLREQRGIHHARACPCWFDEAAPRISRNCTRCNDAVIAFGTGEFTGLCLECAENDYIGTKAERDMLAKFVGRVGESANTHQLAALDMIRWLKLERQEDTIYDRWKRLATTVEEIVVALDIVVASRALPKKMFEPLAGIRDILRNELRRGAP